MCTTVEVSARLTKKIMLREVINYAVKGRKDVPGVAQSIKQHGVSEGAETARYDWTVMCKETNGWG